MWRGGSALHLVGNKLIKPLNDGEVFEVVCLPGNGSTERTWFGEKCSKASIPAAAPQEVRPWGSCLLGDGVPSLPLSWSGARRAHSCIGNRMGS